MATLPSIATTAARRLLPSADLRIEGASPAAFGAAAADGVEAIGQGISQVGSQIARFELAKAQEAEQAAEFERQAQFVEFGAAEDTRLAETSRDIQGPALDFTKNFMGTFDQRSGEFVEKVPERHRDRWRAKFAALRGSLAGAALKTEFGQRDAWSANTLSSSLTKLQNGIAQSPDAMDAYRQQGEALIDSSLLSAQDKADKKTAWRSAAAVAAATGDVELDPEGALRRLGGVEPVMREPEGATEGSGGEGGVPATKPRRPSGALSSSIVSGLTKRGLSVALARGIAAGITAESSNNPVAHNKEGGGQGAFGLGQWRGSRLAELRRRYGNAPTVDQQLDFLVYELRGGDAGGKNVLAQKDEVSTLHHYIHGFMRPSAAGARGDMSRGLSALGREVVAHAEATTERLRDDGSNYGGVAALGEPGSRAAGVASPTSLQGDTEAPRIDPRYADLPLSARMQLIGAAQREIEHRAQVSEANAQEDHAARLNGLLLDLNDGKAGRADIAAAREAGWLSDYAEVERAESILDARDKENVALNNYNAMMNTPGFTFNQFDDDQKAAVNAGVKSLGGTPQAAFQVWQKTGILAEQGSVALRGALASTDSNRVAGAASIASNMLERNPNAFAGVEGGDDIERSALLYRHQVSDLGRTPEQASQIMAQQNTPEGRKRIDASADKLKEFRKELRSDRVASVLSNNLGGWFSIDPSFTAPEQINAVKQDYAELAEEHFLKFGDVEAARSLGMQQIKKLYGAVNGRIMKYPPTRAYPPVNGNHDYIFEQAAADIKRVTKRNIDPKDVYLMPLPTATAEAFRAGRPVPYAVHYVDKVDGQKVYRVLNGQAFVADAGNAVANERRERQENFEAERERRRHEQADAIMRRK